jgi:hypothetical protein
MADDGCSYKNPGLERWEEGRRQWLADVGKPVTRVKRAVNVDIDLVIDRIFSPESDGTLPRAIPLPQLIDLMTDLWEGSFSFFFFCRI